MSEGISSEQPTSTDRKGYEPCEDDSLDWVTFRPQKLTPNPWLVRMYDQLLEESEESQQAFAELSGTVITSQEEE